MELFISEIGEVKTLNDLIRGLHTIRKHRGFEKVIGIEKGKIFSRRLLHPCVAGRACAAVFLRRGLGRSGAPRTPAAVPGLIIPRPAPRAKPLPPSGYAFFGPAARSGAFFGGSRPEDVL